MNIALDYDGTYSAAPELWDMFVRQALKDGHDVRIVTGRRGHREPRLLTEIPIIYCALEPKEAVCFVEGFDPDIWIDDNPKNIFEAI